MTEAWHDFEPWTTICGGIREVTRGAHDVEEGLVRAVDYASARPSVFDENYWLQFATHDFAKPTAELKNFSIRALAKLPPPATKGTEEFLSLDLGDCPEIFSLELFRGDSTLLAAVLSQELSDDHLHHLDHGIELDYLNVSSLRDSILSWNQGGSLDFNGNDGYFAWGCVAALCLLEPLRHDKTRLKILNGRQSLEIVCGFEEMFFSLATLNADSLDFSAA